MARRSRVIRRGRYRRRSPLRSNLMRAEHRLRLGLFILIGLCLLLVLRCLELIGPPPPVRIDALWVHQHSYLVRTMAAALAVSAAATGLLIFARRGLLIALALWGLATTAALSLYVDRLWIIWRVIFSHA